MIILEGGSRPEKQDEAPPLPASLPPQFFGAVLPRTLQNLSPEISDASRLSILAFCLDLTRVASCPRGPRPEVCRPDRTR